MLLHLLLVVVMSLRDVMDKLAAALSGYRSGSNIDADDVEAAAAAADGPPTRLASRAVGYVRVDGHHDSTERLAAVRKFRSDPSIRVALLSITAAAVGEYIHLMQIDQSAQGYGQ